MLRSHAAKGTEIKPDAISPPPPHPSPPQPTPLRVLTGAHDRIITEISKIFEKNTLPDTRVCGFRAWGLGLGVLSYGFEVSEMN